MIDKHFFVLGCVGVLAGIASAAGVIGCSSSDPSNDTATLSDAGTDSGGKQTTTPEAGSSADDSCIDTTPYDATALPFKPPRMMPGSCTDDDRAYFVDTMSANATLAQAQTLMQKRSPDCAACIFAPDGDTWAPIVMLDNGEHIENIGGCFAAVSGNVACGKAYQAAIGCATQACASCTDDQMEGCGIQIKYEGAVCDATYSNYVVECGPDPDAISRRCVTGTFTVEGSIIRLCGGEKADGGT